MFDAKKSHLVIAITAVFTLSACGGEGSKKSQPEPADPPTTEEDTQPVNPTEFNENWGLAASGAQSIHQRGGTGDGQVVAVIDSGVDPDHADLADNLHPDSYDFQNDTDQLSDESGHGTHVSGIIASAQNDTGGHGIAYEAEILSLKYLGERNLPPSQLAKIYEYANEHDAHIFNNSWSFSGSDITRTTEAALSNSLGSVTDLAIELIKNEDTVFVYSAGNNGQDNVEIMAGLPYHIPELKDGWIAVVATAKNGEILDLSNRCGIAKDWCLAAPGDGIFSTANGGEYQYKSGTSMAAPHVSGGLAALKSLFPNLSHHDLLKRLLVTADKSGIYANEDVYGQGFMDLDAASSMVGTAQISTADSTRAQAALHDASASVMMLPASVAQSFGIDTSKTNVLVLDSFQQAPFWSKANAFVQENDLPIMNIQWRSLFNLDKTDQSVNVGNGFRFSAVNADDHQGLSSFALRQTDRDQRFAFGGGRGKLITNEALQLSMDQPWISQSHNHLMASSYRINNVAGINDSGLMVGYAAQNDWLDNGDALDNTTQRQGLYSRAIGEIDEAIVMELNKSWSLGEYAPLGTGLQFTHATLNSPLQFSNASGAFNLQGSDYSQAKFGIQQPLKAGTLKANLSHAMINSESDHNSLVSLPDQIGLTSAQLDYQLSANDRHFFNIGAQYSHATGDAISLRLPTSIDADGNIGYTEYGSDVSNLYNQTAVDMTYNYQLNKQVQLGVQSFWEQTGAQDGNFGAIFGIEVLDK